MKTIAMRLHRLEERFGLQPETEFDRRLRARIEAARRRLAEARERGELQPPETGPLVEACRRIAAASMAEHVLAELPEAVPERFGPTQFLLNLRSVDGAALLTVYHDYRAREPRLAAALVFAGERAWQRLCERLARFVAAGMEVRHVA